MHAPLKPRDHSLLIIASALTAYLGWRHFRNGYTDAPYHDYHAAGELLALLALGLIAVLAIFRRIRRHYGRWLLLPVALGFAIFLHIPEGPAIYSYAAPGESTWTELELHATGTWHRSIRYHQVLTEYGFGSFSISGDTILLHRNLRHPGIHTRRELERLRTLDGLRIRIESDSGPRSFPAAGRYRYRAADA